MIRKLALIFFVALAAPAFATITATDTRTTYTGNGSTTVFTFTFPASNSSDMQVWINGTLIGFGYSVSLNSDQNLTPGGSVTMLSAPAVGIVVMIQRNQPYKQLTTYAPFSAFPAKTAEKSWDNSVKMIQQVSRDVSDLSTTLLAAEAAPGNATLVTATGRATARTLANRAADFVMVSDYLPVGQPDGVTDNSTGIASALQEGSLTGKPVVFGSGTYITLPQFIGSNTTIEFAPSTKVLAKPSTGGGIPTFARLDCLFTANDASHITINMNGATLQMQRAEYIAYNATESSEFRHAIAITSSTDVVINGPGLIEDTGGDGIYIGADNSDTASSSRVGISNIRILNAYRNAISIVNVSDIDVGSVSLEDTNGTDPQSGIDIEPNLSETTVAIRGIKLHNIRCTLNAATCLIISPNSLANGAYDVSVDGLTSYLDGAALTGGDEAWGIRIAANASGWTRVVPGQIVIENFSIIKPYTSAIALESLAAASSPRVIIRNGTIIDINQSGSASLDESVGIWVGDPANLGVNGNFEISNVRVYDSRGTAKTAAAVYLKDNTPHFDNYKLTDVWGWGFTPTSTNARMIIKLGTSTNMSIDYTQPLLNELTFSGTIGSLHDYIGQQVKVTGAGVAPLPAAADVIGQVFRFRLDATATFSIRPASGETILQYGDAAQAASNIGDMVLNFAGDYAEIQAVKASTWQVKFATKQVNRPGGSDLTAPPLRTFWCADGTVPTSVRTWKSTDICWNSNPSELGSAASKYVIIGWLRLTNGSGNTVNTDWRQMRALTGN